MKRWCHIIYRLGFLLSILMIFLLGNTSKLKAQDPQFSQFYNAPLYLNPAFTGTGKEHRIALNTRLQWPSLPKAFQTVAASYDYNLDRMSSGFGLLAAADRAGSGNLLNTNIGFLYSYRVNLNRNWVVSTGVHFSYSFKSLDVNKLLLGDQISDNRNVSFDGELANVRSISFFDFASGILIYSKQFWGGFAAHHITQPNASLIGVTSPVPLKFSAHAGYRIPLHYGPFRRDVKSSIAPSFIYKTQGNFQQLDIGVQWHYAPILAGLWYRGILYKKALDNKVRRDALSFNFGVEIKDWKATYSYDFTISGLGGGSGGAHEISIIYDFKTPKKKKKPKFQPCPSFYD